jgi:putative transposase
MPNRFVCYEDVVKSKPRSGQQELPFVPARAKRPRGHRKPGRKPRADRAGFVVHATRPPHDEKHPVHVTMKRHHCRASLRSQRVFAAIRAQIAHAVRRGIGIVHYTVQDDHVHLLVEATDRERLARGLQYLFSRIALEVNRVEHRHGRLFRDRHHRRALTSPSAVRNALVYVVFNDRKHLLQGGWSAKRDAIDWFDECSSAMWFEDWDPRARPPPDLVARCRDGECPVARPRTWLASTGWKRARGGLLRFDEQPRS